VAGQRCVALHTRNGSGTRRACRPSREAAQQRDAADEGRMDAYGNVLAGKVILYQGEVVRPSQLIASVGQT
jgi:hypothetical protein